MFKKFIIFALALSIFTGQTHASTQEGLKSAFDELNYSLTVDWNQTDKTFYEEQMEKFAAKLSELQSQGLTNSQMMDFVKGEVKDAKIASDLETTFNVIQMNKMTTAQARQYVVETMKKSYNVGASWEGGLAGSLGAVGILFLILAVAVGGSSSSTSNSSGSNCYYRDVEICDSYSYCYTQSEYVCD